MNRSRIAGPHLPLPPDELLQEVRQVAARLEELRSLSPSHMAWGLQPLTQNIQLALRRPQTLSSVENQLDFIEELADAVWREPPLELLGPADAHRPDLVESIWDSLGTSAERLCERVDRWRRKQMGSAAGPVARDLDNGRSSPT